MRSTRAELASVRVALALGALLVAGGARAQQAEPRVSARRIPHDVQVLACDGTLRDDPPLRALLELELTGRTQPLVVRIQGPCEGSEVALVVALGATRIEQRIALAMLPEALRPRALALAVGAAVESLETGPERADGDAAAPEPSDAPPPSVEGRDELAAPIGSAAGPSLAAPQSVASSAWSVHVAVRVFLDGGAWLAGGRLGVAYEWLDVGIGIEGNRQAQDVLAADLLLFTASIGGRATLLETGAMWLTVGGQLEGGPVWIGADVAGEGLVGTDALQPILGAAATLCVGAVLSGTATFEIRLAGGAHWGPTVTARAEPLARLAGPTLSVLLGLSLR